MRMPTEKLCVLVVDADPFVRQSVTRALRAEHEVVALEDAESAWARLEGREAFDLVLYEAAASGMDAVALWKRLVPDHTALRARLVFLVGRTVAESITDFLTQVDATALSKPIDGESLKTLVHGIVAGAA